MKWERMLRGAELSDVEAPLSQFRGLNSELVSAGGTGLPRHSDNTMPALGSLPRAKPTQMRGQSMAQMVDAFSPRPVSERILRYQGASICNRYLSISDVSGSGGSQGCIVSLGTANERF